MEKPLRVFCCYAREDQDYLQEMKKHLMALQREQLIEIIADININPGTDWEREISHHLNEANIILLLISAAFIASDYCFKKEMQQAIARHNSGTARVVPVIIRPTYWGKMPFSKLQALPKDARAVTSWQNKDEAWTNVAEGIRTVSTELLENRSNIAVSDYQVFKADADGAWSGAEKVTTRHSATGHLTDVLATGSQPRISRRAVMIGLGAAIATGAVGGSIVWLKRSQGEQAPSHSSVASTATPIPLKNSLFTYRSHVDAVYELVWSPNSMYVASASFDKTVLVRNVLDEGESYTYRKHTQILKAVAWSPIDNRIASGSQDSTAQVWNAFSGEQLIRYNEGNYVNGIAWSPSGKQIVSGRGDGTVRIWDAASGESIYVYRGHSGYLTKVRWSPDGKRVVSGSGDTTVQVWNAVDGGNPYVYHRHLLAVNAVVWSSDGKYIASGSLDKTVQVWDAINGSRVYTYYRHTNGVNAVTWSPDGKRIASADNDGTVQIWSVTGQGNIYIYRNNDSTPIYTVAWSPDGKLIASGGDNMTVQIWRAP